MAIGAAIAPHVYVNRLLWSLAAFGLAVGVAAHALDELHDRPLHTGISDRTLIALTGVSLLGALAIGVAGVLTVTPWLAPFVVAGVLFVPAYNLRAARRPPALRPVVRRRLGRVPGAHRLLRAGAADHSRRPGGSRRCLALSVAERRLSSPARELRRRTHSVAGTRTRADGATEPLTLAGLLSPLDGALSALSAAMVLLACALVLARV